MSVNLKTTLLRYTRITHKRLVDAGFSTDRLFYEMVDLHIYSEKRKWTGVHFYYYDENGVTRRITNMLQVSKLVYGDLQYER